MQPTNYMGGAESDIRVTQEKQPVIAETDVFRFCSRDGVEAYMNGLFVRRRLNGFREVRLIDARIARRIFVTDVCRTRVFAVR